MMVLPREPHTQLSFSLHQFERGPKYLYSLRDSPESRTTHHKTMGERGKVGTCTDHLMQSHFAKVKCGPPIILFLDSYCTSKNNE